MEPENEFCELNEPVWAVATQSTVIARSLTYDEAIQIVNENLGVTGIAIITDHAAEVQVKLEALRHGQS